MANEPSGRPTVRLTGRCREIADDIGLTTVLVSISHIATHAVASAIGLVGPAGPAVEPPDG